MHLDQLNALDNDAGARALLACCGSTEWAREMAVSRPFDGPESMGQTSDRIWASLERTDWLQAFAAHPKIGQRSASAWASAEQSGVGGAANNVLDRLAAGNRAYEARFGHVFLISAAGRSAEDILAALEDRLDNDPDTELRVAAEEHRRITRLRLERLLGP